MLAQLIDPVHSPRKLRSGQQFFTVFVPKIAEAVRRSGDPWVFRPESKIVVILLLPGASKTLVVGFHVRRKVEPVVLRNNIRLRSA